jgi:uncharacterized protein (TIGR02118 family)
MDEAHGSHWRGIPMTKVIVLLYKRPDLDWDAFQQYWQEKHGPLVVGLPGLRQYIHNHAVEEANPPYGVAEMYFDSADAFHEAFASPAGKTALSDLTNFADVDRTAITIVAEPRSWRGQGQA